MNRSYSSNAAGEYTLDGLPALRILVEFAKSGYELLEISVTMMGDQLRMSRSTLSSRNSRDASRLDDRRRALQVP